MSKPLCDANKNVETSLVTNRVYLEHLLHGQIDTKEFWLEQMQDWETDPLGNTPEQQFELILQEVTAYDYLMWHFSNDYNVVVFNAEYGNGVITQFKNRCSKNILVEVTFDSVRKQDFPLEEILSQRWTILC